MARWTETRVDNQPSDTTIVDLNVAPEMVWVDIETMGLNKYNPILEVGLKVTDRLGRERLSTSRLVFLANADRKLVEGSRDIDPFVYHMHTKNGLLDEIRNISKPNEEGDFDPRAYKPNVETSLIEWLETFTDRNTKYSMAGASVHFDRRVLEHQMPRLAEWFFYRNYDVSTLLEAARLAGMKCDYEKRGIHRALPDIDDEIAVHVWMMKVLSTKV